MLQNEDAYRVSQCKMRRNRPSPAAHLDRAREVVNQWCALAMANGTIEASPREVRTRSAATRKKPQMTPVQVFKYWNDVSRDCIPTWLLDFAPENGLIERLYHEYLGPSEAPLFEEPGGRRAPATRAPHELRGLRPTVEVPARWRLALQMF